MYKSYSFNTVNIESNGRGNTTPPPTVNAPLPNGLTSNPQVVYLGADAVHGNVPGSGSQTTGSNSEKPEMPTWVWYAIGAAIVFFLLKK